MTKEDLAAEIAALRALLTVIGGALPPAPVDDTEQTALYLWECGARLSTVQLVAAAAMKHAGEQSFTRVLHNSALTLRREFDTPLRYQTPPFITDSERTCQQLNPDGSGEHCHRGGDHGVCKDSNGDEWRTDLAGDEPKQCDWRPYPAGSEGDDGTECVLPAGHDEAHDDGPVRITEAAVDKAMAATYGWCPGMTGPDAELDVTLYCDRLAGHDGSHHAPGPDEGSEVAWSDCDGGRGSAAASQQCVLHAGHDGSHRDAHGCEWRTDLPVQVVVAGHCSGCGQNEGHAGGCEFAPGAPVSWGDIFRDNPAHPASDARLARS